jgi:toxin ParE1/3/4
MTVEYSRRAITDLRNIAAYYAGSNHPAVGEAVADRIQEVVARLEVAPRSGRRVAEREGMRVAPLLRFSYNVFYALIGGTVRIVHIRHTSRRPWTGR